MLYIKHISTWFPVAKSIFLCNSFCHLVLSHHLPWGSYSLSFPLSALRCCSFGVCPYRSATWGCVVKQRPADCWSTYLILGKLPWKYSIFLMFLLLVVHDRHLHCETAVQRADGGVPLLVMRDSFLTKEVLISPVFLLHIEGIFSPYPFLLFFLGQHIWLWPQSRGISLIDQH